MSEQTQTEENTIQLTDPRVTRYPSPMIEAPSLSREEKIDFIADRMREIMEVLGLDLEDDSLRETPQRIARMYIDEIFAGLDLTTFPRISLYENRYDPADHGGFVQVRCSFTSYCEHHFVPMTGIADVAYIPNEKLIGLSKITRIVRFFAKRPQLQERLTIQIADCLSLLLDTQDVAVWLRAKHHCVVTRGIQDSCSDTTTQCLLGRFKDEELYSAFRRECPRE